MGENKKKPERRIKGLTGFFDLEALEKKWDAILKISREIRYHVKRSFFGRKKEKFAEFLFFKLQIMLERRDGSCNIEHHFLESLKC